MNNKLSPRQIDAIETVQSKPELEPFFFQKIKGLKWFDELYTRGFFNPDRNPKLKESEDKGFFMIPFWPMLEYLEKTAPELQNGNLEYVGKYLEVIRSVTRVSIDSDISNYRTWWYFAKVIKFIPIDQISIDDVILFSFWLKDKFDRMLIADELGNHFLPKLLNEGTPHSYELSLKLIEALTQLQWVPKTQGSASEAEPKLFIDDWHADKLFRKQSMKIGAVLEVQGVNIIKNRIEEIIQRTEKNDYSTIWRPAIEDHDQNTNRSDALNILITAFRDALCGYVDRRASAAGKYIEGLFTSKFDVVRRVAIYIAGVYYDSLQSIAGTLIDPKYISYRFQHEMFHYLKNNFAKFNVDQKTLTIQIIDSLTVKSDEAESIIKRQIAYKKLIWLTAIKEQGVAAADDLYKQNFNIVKRAPEHPDFSSYMESGWIEDLSPFSSDDLLGRGIDHLITLVNSFHELGGWKTPTKRGLAKEFKNAIINNPEYFKGNLHKFMNVDFAYIFEIIEAYKELWKDKKYDNWAEVLNFCENLICEASFWNEENNKDRGSLIANRAWIVGAIAELLRAGTASDENAFEPSFLSIAKKILMTLLDKQESEEFRADSDAVFISINSPRGKIIEALFDYSLRVCRLADKNLGNHSEAWLDLQPLYDKELLRSFENNYEFVTLSANYLPNLLYINRKWALDNLKNIFQRSPRLHWLCAIQGYSYVSSIYPEIYRFLKEGGHYLEVLDAIELKSEVKKRVIQYIVVGYVRGEESLDDKNSLISKLFDRWNMDELNEIIWFVRTFQRDNDDKRLDAIITLWKTFSDKITGKVQENKGVLSNLCLWSVFIKDFNDTLPLIKQAAPYAPSGHNAYILIENLRRLVDNYPQQVGEIFLTMMEFSAPTYEEEDILYILRKLYSGRAEEKRQSNVIIDKYITYGVDYSAKVRD
ncbi:MAG TPA: hypothetical protein PK178_06935 [Smithellaceae bacterium]|nr:hypothetical protein [Smithellaceae bacterium]HPL48460.1 hypothetical protein [Smithella sp.]